MGLTKQTTVPALTPQRLRRFNALQRVAALIITLLSMTSYVILDRTLQLQRETAAAIDVIQAQRVRVAESAGTHARRTRGATELRAANPAVAASVSRARRAGRTALLLRGLGAATSGGLLVMMLAYTLGLVGPMVRRARRQASDLAELALLSTTDPLTGILNTRGFQDRCTLEIHKAKRYNRPLSLLMVDPDGFAAINSAHGRRGADTILRALTATLERGTRDTDLVGRVGAEEFGVLLPETDCNGAQLVAERLRARISELVVPVDGSAVSCTVSIGIAAAEKNADLFWPTFKRADEALYEAKMRGRNRVFVNV